MNELVQKIMIASGVVSLSVLAAKGWIDAPEPKPDICIPIGTEYIEDHQGEKMYELKEYDCFLTGFRAKVVGVYDVRYGD